MRSSTTRRRRSSAASVPAIGFSLSRARQGPDAKEWGVDRRAVENVAERADESYDKCNLPPCWTLGWDRTDCGRGKFGTITSGGRVKFMNDVDLTGTGVEGFPDPRHLEGIFRRVVRAPLSVIYHGTELRSTMGEISADLMNGLHDAFTYLWLRRPRLEDKVHLLDKRQVCRGRAARSLSLSLLRARARARTAPFPTAPSPAYPRSWLQLISSGAPLLRRRQVGASVCNANSVVVLGSDERGH